jgi:hypothetical protein
VIAAREEGAKREERRREMKVVLLVAMARLTAEPKKTQQILTVAVWDASKILNRHFQSLQPGEKWRIDSAQPVG